MSVQWLSAVASLVTLLLIAASAGAALMQMRHMRSANQIIALTEVREKFESTEFHAVVTFAMREFPKTRGRC